MKNLKIFTKIKIPTITLAVLTAIVATIVGTTISAHAWGPEDRPTYTNQSPADYATFNSITNNVAVGDERNFVRIREANTDQTYVDQIEVVPGHEYEVYIYYHNNAASDTNESGLGMATNARVASAYPTVVNTNERGMISGIITWSYVTPTSPNTPQEGKVWDEAYVTSQTNGVVLRYKTGTATIHNAGQTNGTILPTTLFSNEGTPLGYIKLIGNLPGCAEYSGYVTYILVAENPGAELTKQVSLDGENWYDRVTVQPGDFVTYKAVFRNTGNVDFTNLIMKDTHDDGLLLRADSTTIYNYDNVNGYKIDDIIDISGHNTGDSYAGAITQVIYQMQVREGDASLCGKVLVNTMSANYNTTENKTAGAEVKVYCESEDPPTDEDCNTNPNLPGCVTPTPTPTPENCNTNPNLPGCNLPTEIVQTGPLEIVMAVIVILGIGAGGFYLWRTRRTLKTVENVVTGDAPQATPTAAPDISSNIEPAAPVAPSTPSMPISQPETPPSQENINPAPVTPESTSAAPEPTTAVPEPLTPAGFSTPAQLSQPAQPTQPDQPTEPTNPAPDQPQPDQTQPYQNQ